MTLEKVTVKPVNKREIVAKGKAIYEKIREEVEREHKGEVIVIEVESGDYFIGKTGPEASKKAREKYPHKVFYKARIGYPTYISYT
ncbi:MAG: hypothetical protein ACE5MB_07360 [Anaerolineae bacterium]